ncbi:MAG: glycosyltransferase [Pseudomonas sp.]
MSDGAGAPSGDAHDRGDVRLAAASLWALVRRWRLSRELKAVRFRRLGVDSGNFSYADEAPEQAVRDPIPGMGPGVNLYGYLTGEFGLGQSARMYARALLAVGYPVALNEVPIEIPHARNERSLDAYLGQDACHPINLVFVNPDHYAELLPVLRPGTYSIGFWFWELEVVPDAWRALVERVDEIWVASRFVEDAFRSITDKPVVRIPHPLQVRRVVGWRRRSFDLDDEAFVFLHSFDFNSSIHRKNPQAVIDAFVRAFEGRHDRVQLMLKTSNGHLYPDALRQLRRSARRDGRIVVRDQVLDTMQLEALQEAADAYVSLHRAEGLGLGMAECMARGKPVIGTGWSGNLEFMTPENSLLVGYRLIPVAEGQYALADQGRWAEADVAQAAQWMRRLVDERWLPATIGAAARADIGNRMNFREAARVMAARLAELAGSGRLYGHVSEQSSR